MLCLAFETQTLLCNLNSFWCPPPVVGSPTSAVEMVLGCWISPGSGIEAELATNEVCKLIFFEASAAFFAFYSRIGPVVFGMKTATFQAAIPSATGTLRQWAGYLATDIIIKSQVVFARASARSASAASSGGMAFGSHIYRYSMLAPVCRLT